MLLLVLLLVTVNVHVTVNVTGSVTVNGTLSNTVSVPVSFPVSVTVTDLLNVKIHYFPIGLKVKILNTLTPLAPIHLTLFPPI